MREQYRGIDVAKFLCAVLIIILHVSPFNQESICNTFFRETVCIIAVPCFFAFSGFLISDKLDKDKFPKSVNANYKKYIVWSIIYFPIVILGWIISDNSFSKNILLFIRDFFFEGAYLTIWFLNALAFAVLFEWILLRFFSKKTCFIISIPIYLLSCLLSSYNQFFCETLKLEFLSDCYYTVFSSTKNGLLFGLPFVSMGVFLKDVVCKKTISKKISFSGMIASFVLLIGEVFVRNSLFHKNKSVDFAILLIPFVVFSVLFVTAFNIGEKPCPKIIRCHSDWYVFLRHMSVMMFLNQRIFIFVYDVLDKIFERSIGVNIISSISIVHFLLVLSSTLLFSYLVMFLSKRYECIKRLYL